MNINKLIDRIKKRIGLNGILKDVYNDKILYDSIINVSLNTLNNMHGFSLKGNLDSYVTTWGININSSMIKQPSDSSAYGVANYNDAVLNIPKELKEKMKELGCELRRVYITEASRPNYFTTYSADIREELMGIRNNMNYRRNFTKPEVQFRYPDTILLKNYVNSGRIFRLSGYNLYIQVTHPKNLSTITRGVAEFFENLCMYDIMINIFNNELSLLNIDLGNSRVELSLEQFSSAASNRETLISSFKEKAAYDEILIF